MTDAEKQKKKFFRADARTVIALLLALSILAVYIQVRHFDFVSIDDPLYVTDNLKVQQGLTWETFAWSFSDATWQTNYWVPLTWLSILLDYQLYGMNAGGYHLTNVFFHILNTVLLFWVLDRTTGRTRRSAFVAALFALHPLHVESVAWVTERKDMLSSLFWMLTLLAYHRYVQRPGALSYFTVFLCLLCGLMSKPMLVTLPFVLLLMDFWPLARFQANFADREQKRVFLRLVREKIPFFVLVALFSVMAFWTQAQEGAVKSLSDYPMAVRVANALVNYVKYIGDMFWPVDLAFLYPHPGALPFVQVFGAAVLLVLVSFAIFKFIQSYPYAVFGWLWYLGTLVPVIGIVVIGPYAMADRYTYVPLVGLFVILAWGIPDLLGKWRYKGVVLASLATGILLFLSVVSWVQAGYWQNNIALYRRAIEVTQDNLGAYLNLGVALQEKGKFDEAKRCYLKMIQIDPDNSSAYNNLGFLARQTGNISESIAYYQKALQKAPLDSSVHNNLGNTLAAEGRPDEALAYYEKAIELNPRYAVAFYNAGNIYLEQYRLNRAIDRYRAALRIDPEYTEAHNSLGGALTLQGKTNDAIFHFREALRLRPGFVEAQNNLKKAMHAHQQADEDIRRLEMLAAQAGGDVKSNFQLGNLYKARGDLDAAFRSYERAARIDPGFIDAVNQMGIIRAMKGDYRQARSFFKASIQKRPDIPQTYYLVASTYARQNRIDEAVDWLKKSVTAGFHNWESMKSDPNLENIRHTAYYKEISKER